MMAVVETPLLARLNDHAGLSAISGLTIWAVLAPERTPSPYIVFRGTDEDVNRHFTANSEPTTTFEQVTVFASDFDKIIEVSIQLKAALTRFSGTSGGVVVQQIFYDGFTDRYDQDDDYYQRDHDFIVHWEE